MGLEADLLAYILLVLRLRMMGAMPLLTHVLSWHAQWQFQFV